MRTEPPSPFSIPQTVFAAAASVPVVRLNSTCADSPESALSWIFSIVTGGRTRVWDSFDMMDTSSLQDGKDAQMVERYGSFARGPNNADLKDGIPTSGPCRTFQGVEEVGRTYQKPALMGRRPYRAASPARFFGKPVGADPKRHDLRFRLKIRSHPSHGPASRSGLTVRPPPTLPPRTRL